MGRDFMCGIGKGLDSEKDRGFALFGSDCVPRSFPEAIRLGAEKRCSGFQRVSGLIEVVDCIGQSASQITC